MQYSLQVSVAGAAGGVPRGMELHMHKGNVTVASLVNLKQLEGLDVRTLDM